MRQSTKATASIRPNDKTNQDFLDMLTIRPSGLGTVVDPSKVLEPAMERALDVSGKTPKTDRLAAIQQLSAHQLIPCAEALVRIAVADADLDLRCAAVSAMAGTVVQKAADTVKNIACDRQQNLALRLSALQTLPTLQLFKEDYEMDLGVLAGSERDDQRACMAAWVQLPANVRTAISINFSPAEIIAKGTVNGSKGPGSSVPDDLRCFYIDALAPTLRGAVKEAGYLGARPTVGTRRADIREALRQIFNQPGDVESKLVQTAAAQALGVTPPKERPKNA